MKHPRIKKTIRLILGVTVCVSLLLAGTFTAAWFMFPFPADRLQRFSPNPAVYDVSDRHMLSVVSPDGQWCTPVELDNISPWLIKATIAIEDQRYYEHPGVDALAVSRAAIQNIRSRRIVSGASTLTMQVCRMMDDRPRTLAGKCVEAFRALQLNHLKSKDEILQVYLNTAPYGGNLRGAEAASIMYFSKHARELSIAEAALLAGLPKSPTRYNPRKHLADAIRRRKTVLKRMNQAAMISPAEYQRAESCPVIINHLPRNRHAMHAAWMALERRPLGGRTCIDLDIQRNVEHLAAQHIENLPAGTELAVVIIDIAQSAIVALSGSGDSADPVDGQVNGALAKRSPGSALKPFIYAAAFAAGRLAPESTVYDVPINLSGWQPANFDRTFHGPVSAADALRQSLNSPALQIAKGLGLGRCYGLIESAGIPLAASARRRAGLALAVGGVEVSLLDLTNAYACLGADGRYAKARLFADESIQPRQVLDANVCSGVSHILSSKNRRPHGTEDVDPDQIPWFAWKTGTSSGRRDAWAVGHNRRYAIGVWAGRFRGTGHVEYVGAQSAEPFLARLFDLPAVRNDRTPAPNKPLKVTKPLPHPVIAGRKLQITNPADGDTFVALSGAALIRPAANSDEGVTWFLNGRLLANRSFDEALNLAPGRYKLHCIDQSGQSSTVNFRIK